MSILGKCALVVMACALGAATVSTGVAVADAPKAPWKEVTERKSHEIAVAIGLVPAKSSPQQCTDTLVLRADQRIALTWKTRWGLKPEREGVCGDRQPIAGDDFAYTSGYLSLRGADGTWSVIQDMAAPDCRALERALVDANVGIDGILAVIGQVVRLSPLKKCKLTIVDDQTPWRSGSVSKMRGVAVQTGAAPSVDFPDRCYTVDLLRVDPRVAILSKTRWGARPEQYRSCGMWESFARPIAVWDGARWKRIDDTYTADCSGLDAALRAHGVPQAGIDQVLKTTLGYSTGTCQDL